ncbi:MAG TPA: hypothetical protein VIK10_07625 [Prolixibacteraceae bacterium]
MDKIKWLKVIREELAILDELAIGMIEDANLTTEEVELAITRSKIVVSEFEILYKQLVDAPTVVTSTEIPESLNETIEEVQITPIPNIDEPSVILIVDPSPEIPVSEMKEFPVEADQNLLYIEEHQEYQPQFKTAPLNSLKEGLSLNDRYLFQRELFENDKSKLDEAIAALDQLENIKEAVVYLKANFRWNRSEASEKFVHLVKRRFS